MTYRMELLNSFVGHSTQPTDTELADALGAAAPVWEDAVSQLSESCNITAVEWRCYSVKSGWAMRLNRGKRTVVWLSPGYGCFGSTFILGTAALQAVREAGLSPAGVQAVDAGIRYPEGTSVRLLIKSSKDLGDVTKLAVAKISH